MDVAKFIRALGYIVYTILWLPVIIIGIAVTAIIYAVLAYKAEIAVREAYELWYRNLMHGIAHDMNFIKTGEW